MPSLGFGLIKQTGSFCIMTGLGVSPKRHEATGNAHNTSFTYRRKGTKPDTQQQSIQGGSINMEPISDGGHKDIKARNAAIRIFWGAMMIAAFLILILAGHLYVVLLVCILQTMIFKEVIGLAHIPYKQKNLPWFRTFSWYFLFTTLYFLYGESLFHQFSKSALLDAFISPFALHHRFISYALYTVGMMLFVLNLKKGFYKFQFAQFAWTHMILILVVVQLHLAVHNIFEGLIWFVLPASTVIINDISAYACGKIFGRTPLIRISPKKTWEGFLGALFCTMVFGFFFARFLCNYDYMICKVSQGQELHVMTSFMSFPTCEKSNIFKFQEYPLPRFIIAFLKHLRIFNELKSIYIAPIQFHSLAFSIFASLIAPFGGFFASGLKRAFKLKDFADSIPGHGGVTDRMDCQIIMGTFSFLYVSSFIYKSQLTVPSIFHTIVTRLNVEDQLDLYQLLGEYLLEQGLIPV